MYLKLRLKRDAFSFNWPCQLSVCADMVCAPRELLRPMTPRSQNVSRRLFSFSSSWRSRTLPLSAKTSMSVMASRPDLVDIAYALEIREVTHGKEKLTKKDIQDLINSHFDSHPEKRQDPRFEGIFNSRRRPRVNENTAPFAGPSMQPPMMQPPILPQPFAAMPLSSNSSNVNIMPPAPFPTAGPLQLPLHPQFIYPHHFTPGPHTVNLHVPYSNSLAPYSYPHP